MNGGPPPSRAMQDFFNECMDALAGYGPFDEAPGPRCPECCAPIDTIRREERYETVITETFGAVPLRVVGLPQAFQLHPCGHVVHEEQARILVATAERRARIADRGDSFSMRFMGSFE